MDSGTGLQHANEILDLLHKRGVEGVLYGSLGVSTYLGDFKTFNDIDILLPAHWLAEDWEKLQIIMQTIDFKLINQKEHEFHHTDGTIVNFAGLNIFDRDGIAFDRETDIVNVRAGSRQFKTFTPALFKRAYEYSVKDGYRIEQRGKKDQIVLDLLDRYIADNM